MRGGVADKLGNDYEAHWTLVEALRVLRGEAAEIRLEPFNEDAKGFEFRLTSASGDAWHQCKRKLVSGNWTIGALNQEGILSNFARKFAEPSTTCVFVSADPAPGLRSLVDKAGTVQSPADFEDALSEGDRTTIKALREVWNVTPDMELDWLKRLRLETVSVLSLRRELDAVCGLLFSASTDDAILALLDFLEGAITKTVTTSAFRAAIDGLGIGWKAGFDETIEGKVNDATRRYLASLPAKIGGRDIETPESMEAVSAVLDGGKKFVVLAGTAGGGKSATITRIIDAAEAKGWPVLAFRLDRFLNIQSMRDLGSAVLERDESPVGAFGNRFHQRDALIVIDQVDAISDASGRSGLIRDILFQLIAQSDLFPKVRVVLACRSFDLENDSRLKSIASSVRTTSVTLKPFDWDRDVLPVLESAGAARPSFTEGEKRNLSIPINLQLFMAIAASGVPYSGEVTGAKLFDQLLEIRAKEFRATGISWTPAMGMGLIAQSMSANQELTAPESVLSQLPGAVAALSSAGLISAVGGKVQFAHESFFDHSFSHHFLASGQTVLSLLNSDEQRLFRRTQVRQIFARLRDQGANRLYQRNLAEVMNSDSVRYLVKDAIGIWLATVDEPTDQERSLVLNWFPTEHALSKISRTVFNGQRWLPSLLRGGLIAKWLEASDEDKALGLWLLKKSAVSHSSLVSQFLRSWWGGDVERTPELLDWFATLYPDDDIGELEALYGDVIAVAPPDRLNDENWTESVDIGTWVNKKAGLGARVLGMWLRRWMAAFPDRQPFGRHIGGNDNYWLQELSEKAPRALVEQIFPVFAEALCRDLAAFADGAPIQLHLLFRGQDDGYLSLLTKALEQVAREDAVYVETLLETLPVNSQVALYLKLKAITAGGQALAHLLPTLFDREDLMSLGESGGDWMPFAEAARVAMPFLLDEDRSRLEELVLSHRPEIDWGLEYMRRREEFAASGWGRDWKPHVIYQLSISGTKERAILRTIGPEYLSQRGQSRLAELDRKFPNAPLPEAHGIRGGWVQSPISPEVAEKMSDAQWLKAMKRYATNEGHVYRADSVIGGARQLASVLRGRAKIEPERFVNLLETMPSDLNDTYAEAIVSGLRDAETTPELAARAIRLVLTKDGDEFHRTICWLVQRYSEVAADQAILSFVIDVAQHGSASDDIVRSSRSEREPRTDMRALLHLENDWESSGINGDRGSAYEALAKILWNLPDTLDIIGSFVEQQSEVERLNSVRVCMLHVVNSIGKYDGPRAVTLMKKFIEIEPLLILGGNGQHFMNWALYAYPDQFIDLIASISAMDAVPLRAIGRVLESGLAISDEGREAAFLAKFSDDDLARQAGAFRASGNLTNGSVGDRAVRWIEPLFDDVSKAVRDEASHVNWERLLSKSADRAALLRSYVNSRAFEDHPDRAMRALSDQLDEYPELALEAVRRVLNLLGEGEVDRRRRLYMATYGVGRTLVRLYRAFESDPEREAEMLDLFDLYLARDVHDMRKEIEAYERF
ncbi:hypothetical protein CA606_11240 [Caulobacter vibrioides]|uniref:ATP-binding protein n=1 Tax=Caulobacter vibrioides TaxID=155892 RepID=A0A290MLB8_CAUVI|nr:ATP-binding protein [Caulobacter vibrioides]ATC32856.1 hypothetical protein CA606_11240 [Caulobacter vibrioides]